MADRPSRDPIERLSQRIRDLERTITELSTRPLVIPVLDVDPPTDYPSNIWAFPDGKLNIRLKDGTVRQYTSVAPTAATTTNPTPPAQPITREGTWSAVWGQAYRASGAFTGANNSMLYQGRSDGSSINGRQRSLIGFDYAAIAAALAGAQVTGVSIWLSVVHTWYGNGGTAWFGLHNNAAKPGAWGGTIGRDFITSGPVPNSGGKWTTLSTEFGAQLRDGTAKGVTLQAPNDDRQYYLYARGGPGTDADQLPQLKITYVK